MDECCGWNYLYQNEVLTFISSEPFGYTTWNIQVPEDTVVQFTCSMLDPNSPFIDVFSDSPLTAVSGLSEKTSINGEFGSNMLHVN